MLGQNRVFHPGKPPPARHSTGPEAADSIASLIHGLQLVVEEFRREILAVEPGDRCKSVVEIELRKAVAIAQRLELLAVQFVRQVHDPLAPIVEFQPDLVVTQIPRVDHVPGCKLVPSQQVPPFAKWTMRAVCDGRRPWRRVDARGCTAPGTQPWGKIGARRHGDRLPRAPRKTTASRCRPYRSCW